MSEITPILGDALEKLKNIPNDSIDLVVTDPPYNLKREKWDILDENFHQKWINECFRVLKRTGSFYSFMSWQSAAEFKLLLDKYGKLKNWIIWERSKGRSCQKNYKSIREDLFYYTKSNDFYFKEQKKIRPVIAPYRDKAGNPKGWFIDEEGNRLRWTGVGNIWHYTSPNWSSKLDRLIHPMQKPIALIERILNSSSKENDFVLDPFMGSGSVGVACKRLNRNFTGIENDLRYFEQAKERINNTSQNLL